VGTDALKVMDTNESHFTMSPLRTIIEGTPVGTDSPAFGSQFGFLINRKSNTGPDYIHYTASYSYLNPADNSVNRVFLNASRNLTGGEHAVRATKWVIVNKKLPPVSGVLADRAVLVEVLMWRD
jgi:hypothetical protein